MFLYMPLKEHLSHPNLGNYISYGIRVRLVRKAYCKDIVFVSDISTDPKFISHISILFTREQLDPIHLPDVLEDLL